MIGDDGGPHEYRLICVEDPGILREILRLKDMERFKEEFLNYERRSRPDPWSAIRQYTSAVRMGDLHKGSP